MYTLTFYEALKEVLENNKWVRGDEFDEGIFLKLNSNKELVIVDANNLYQEIAFQFWGFIHLQNFRIINVATIKELSK